MLRSHFFMPWGHIWFSQTTKMAKKKSKTRLLYASVAWGLPFTKVASCQVHRFSLVSYSTFFSEINFWSSMNSGEDKLNLIFIADNFLHQWIILRKPIQGIILMKQVCLKFRSAKADLFKTTSCWQICFPTGNIRDKMNTLKCFLG